MTSVHWLPLTEVSEDARDAVRAFRELGGMHYGSFSVDQSRVNFVRACEMNGITGDEPVVYEDMPVPVADGSIIVRLYRPRDGEDNEENPLVVFIHGGGWVIGSVDTHDGICRHLARHSRCPVASVEYRRAPEHQWPVPLEDCERALDYLITNAPALSINTSRVVLAGDSAGGNMATIIANAASTVGSTVIGQILFYPVTDLTATLPSYQRIQGGFPLVAESMFWFRDHYVPAGVPFDLPRLSPLLHAEGRRQPPMFIATMGLDPLCDEGIAYASCAARAGSNVEHHHLPGHHHGIVTAARNIAAARYLLERAVSFVRRLAETR
ncbi:alpha/beta hydrolase [Paraburkholderia sp. CNPSo 3281]|uniref:alpha/beta hydrolase n=1 Tax=Paraburkholderia sp. CNPSo 3281 TaxID=2940933 RepID=UPI0020B83D8B|nr:alpha/beta hydrolase [Paraburkholderia sp. CNPSo 3281]MCP3717346.1 alpha/beta hydrolase [Paraburkholderia sp. CNPSo 3281]